MGDCYLIATMSELNQEIIRDVFITQKPSEEYELRIYVRGRPWIVKVDDQFLYHKELDNLRYAYV